VPYNARTIKALQSFNSGSNSGPQIVQYFSDDGAVKYVFWMPPTVTSSSLSAACTNAIRTVSLEVRYFVGFRLCFDGALGGLMARFDCTFAGCSQVPSVVFYWRCFH